MVSSIDLTLLGMVYGQPHSAYDIQKHVGCRNLSHWVKISSPSVYKKPRMLEQKEYLMTKRQREENMPEKSIYSLTHEGRKYFHELMHEISAQPFEILFGFNTVVVGLNKVNKEEGLEYVQRITQGLRDTRTYLSMQRDTEKEIPYMGGSILEQQPSICETLLTWCRILCGDLKSSDGLGEMRGLPRGRERSTWCVHQDVVWTV